MDSHGNDRGPECPWVARIQAWLFGQEALGCSCTQGYWKNRAEAWSVYDLVLGNITHARQDHLIILG